MFFDMQGHSPGGDIFAYPDWVFSSIARTDLRDANCIDGGDPSAGENAITGTPDCQSCC